MATFDTSVGTFATSAFRLAASAVALFLLVAVALAFVLMRMASDAVTSDVMSTIEAEADRLALAYRTRGPQEVSRLVAEMAAAPGRGLYLVRDSAGRLRGGNLAEAPPALSSGEAGQGSVFKYERTRPGSTPEERQAAALAVVLGDGSRVIVGRDIEEQRRRLANMRLVLALSLGALVVAGLAAGYAASRHVLKRVDAVNDTARSIMTGNLSQRIPETDENDEIARLSSNLNAMLDRIELLMQSLREVSDNIAHDLKTPLNRLRNRAEAALRDRQGEAAYREGLAHVIDEADGLIKTFNALLLIARLEAGALEETADEIDVAALVRDVAELYQPVAEEQGLELSIVADGPLPLCANRHLIGQAVANLIDNAIKYSAAPRCGAGSDNAGADGRIEVRVRREGSNVSISVGDRGPGIPAADRERVLKRFVRLERSRSRPGTGLGLSLVAAVARLHGGSVRLEDAAPGLRVVLTMPARAAIAAA